MVECAPRVCSTGCAGRVSGVCRDVMPRCWVTHSVVAAHIVLDNTRKNANCHGPTYRPWQTSRALVARRALLDVRDQATASTITTQTTVSWCMAVRPSLGFAKLGTLAQCSSTISAMQHCGRIEQLRGRRAHFAPTVGTKYACKSNTDGRTGVAASRSTI